MHFIGGVTKLCIDSKFYHLCNIYHLWGDRPSLHYVSAALVKVVEIDVDKVNAMAKEILG